MKDTTNRLIAMLFTLLLAFGAVACENTEEGLEEDVQDAEQEIEEGAEDVEQAVPEDVEVDVETEG